MNCSSPKNHQEIENHLPEISLKIDAEDNLNAKHRKYILEQLSFRHNLSKNVLMIFLNFLFCLRTKIFMILHFQCQSTQLRLL